MRITPFAQGLLFIAGGNPILPRLPLPGLGDQVKPGGRHLFQRLAHVIGNVGRHAELGPRLHDPCQQRQIARRDKAAAVVPRLGPRVGIVQEGLVQTGIGQDVEQVALNAAADAIALVGLRLRYREPDWRSCRPMTRKA